MLSICFILDYKIYSLQFTIYYYGLQSRVRTSTVKKQVLFSQDIKTEILQAMVSIAECIYCGLIQSKATSHYYLECPYHELHTLNTEHSCLV